jgi:hypothetical protein
MSREGITGAAHRGRAGGAARLAGICQDLEAGHKIEGIGIGYTPLARPAHAGSLIVGLAG